jgi:hypothetical protein
VNCSTYVIKVANVKFAVFAKLLSELQHWPIALSLFQDSDTNDPFLSDVQYKTAEDKRYTNKNVSNIFLFFHICEGRRSPSKLSVFAILLDINFPSSICTATRNSPCSTYCACAKIKVVRIRFRGRCYDTIFGDFRQFSAIFDNFRRKKLASFSKTNVMIKILHN